MWRERVVGQTRQVAQFKSFREFVEAYPPEGLHTTIQLLIHICNDFGDMEAVSLISMESAGTAGAPTGNANASKTNVDIVHNCSELERPSGNSTPATMRRLAKRNPALLAQVVAGEMSPNAAAVQAGFRKKNLQVPDDPTRAAQWFRSHKDEGWIGTFVNELVK